MYNFPILFDFFFFIITLKKLIPIIYLMHMLSIGVPKKKIEEKT